MIENHPAPTLVADLGGTNVRFAIAHTALENPLIESSIRPYAVADFASMSAAARQYLSEISAQPARAVFAVAGRVEGDEVRITNLPWVISNAQIRGDLALSSLRIVNDFAGMSMSVPLLAAGDLQQIGNAVLIARPPDDTRTIGVIGPGTGLGVGAYLVRDGRPQVLETEGGHVAFAPGTPEEIEILRLLSKRFGRVSNERLICGSGLVNIYQALCVMANVAAQDFSPEQITARAQQGTDASCQRAIEIFCAVLGSIAGDLALAIGAWDGIYLAGGIVPRLLPWLHQGGFRRRFEDKGRFAATMQTVPTLAITNAYAGLLGAAGIAKNDEAKRHGVAAIKDVAQV